MTFEKGNRVGILASGVPKLGLRRRFREEVLRHTNDMERLVSYFVGLVNDPEAPPGVRFAAAKYLTDQLIDTPTKPVQAEVTVTERPPIVTMDLPKPQAMIEGEATQADGDDGD